MQRERREGEAGFSGGVSWSRLGRGDGIVRGLALLIGPLLCDTWERGKEGGEGEKMCS